MPEASTALSGLAVLSVLSTALRLVFAPGIRWLVRITKSGAMLPDIAVPDALPVTGIVFASIRYRLQMFAAVSIF
ncbi:hypothetical protein LG200_03085 [Methylobacillus caricis]|uniref:hypothetical protein n=1 Tax=Methylobacillus caricis TaxID=1971611 RepID=UPI001CFFDC21|nr:hypothetical protein [Methylobacillus caricis]MCB5186988.1 hypothetical protein [Methylobacillus caricis]